MKELALEKIKPNPDQPRKIFDEESIKALAESIEKDGLLQPIVVKSLEDGNYQIVIGERRYRAHKLLGRKSIKCLIRENGEDLVISLIENLQREDLSPIEEAEAYQKLLNAGLTQTELGKRVGKSQSQIAQKMALLNLHEWTIHLMRRKYLSEGQGRQLLRLGKAIREFRTLNFEWPMKVYFRLAYLDKNGKIIENFKVEVKPEQQIIKDYIFRDEFAKRLTGGSIKYLELRANSWEEVLQIKVVEGVGLVQEGATVLGYKEAVNEVIEDFAHMAELYELNCRFVNIKGIKPMGMLKILRLIQPQFSEDEGIKKKQLEHFYDKIYSLDFDVRERWRDEQEEMIDDYLVEHCLKEGKKYKDIPKAKFKYMKKDSETGKVESYLEIRARTMNEQEELKEYVEDIFGEEGSNGKH